MGFFRVGVLVCLLVWCLFGFSWNNRLREAVVTEAFLFLSTFFIQALRISYLARNGLSIALLLKFSIKLCITLELLRTFLPMLVVVVFSMVNFSCCYKSRIDQ